MNKIKLLLIAGITGSVVLVFVIFMLISNFNPQTTPPPSVNPTPTSFQYSEIELFITSIIPEDRNNIYTPPQPLQITFTQDVNPQDLKYTTSPQTEVLVVKGEVPKTLIFAPRTFWQNGATTITFLNTTTSTTGLPLKNPQAYIINVAIPTIPPNLEGAY